MKRGYANSFDFNPAIPLSVPFGPYYHKASGKTQIVDRRSAEAFRVQIANAQAEGAPGLPIYAGHPDVPELAAKYPDKAAKGWVTKIDLLNTACDLHVAWLDPAPAPGQFIYFSPWFAGEDTGGPDVLIDELRSIGLTNRPNTTRFRLPNEAGAEDERTTTMKELLKLLGLEETATEQDAIAALQKLKDELAALKRTGEETAATVSAANEALEKAKSDFANERALHLGLLLDCAIAEGRVTPATRPVWEARLRKDFANERVLMAQAERMLKTKATLPNEAADASPAGILARYVQMPDGAEKAAFLHQHALVINNARCAAGQ
jgi:hypothetical protein